MVNIKYKDGVLYRTHKNGVCNELRSISVCNGKKYIKLTVGYRAYYAHRYIWEMHHGPVPEGKVIDHIDGDTLNNRIENLRCVTQSANLLNKNNKLRKDNTSGIRGISFCKRDKKWKVQSCKEGVGRFMGQSNTLAGAVQLQQSYSLT